MRRCFQLAANGLGRVRPNPLVGCVVVKDGRIVSEGYHQEYGHNHAERNALLRTENGERRMENTPRIQAACKALYRWVSRCSPI